MALEQVLLEAQKEKQAGSDLLYRMTVTFEEAVHGSKRDIEVECEDECSECHGEGGFNSHTCPECKDPEQ